MNRSVAVERSLCVVLPLVMGSTLGRLFRPERRYHVFVALAVEHVAWFVCCGDQNPPCRDHPFWLSAQRDHGRCVKMNTQNHTASAKTTAPTAPTMTVASPLPRYSATLLLSTFVRLPDVVERTETAVPSRGRAFAALVWVPRLPEPAHLSVVWLHRSWMASHVRQSWASSPLFGPVSSIEIHPSSSVST